MELSTIILSGFYKSHNISNNDKTPSSDDKPQQSICQKHKDLHTPHVLMVDRVVLGEQIPKQLQNKLNQYGTHAQE